MEAELKTIGLLHTPFADLIPAATVEENESLRASIATRGMDHGPDVDEEDNILDGHRRYAVAPDEAYRKRVTHNGLTQAEKEAWVFRTAMGPDHGRNLDRDQLAAVRERMKATAANLKSVDGKTQEQIAYLLGVAQNTISDWLSTIAADNVQPTDPAADPATELNRDRRKKLTAAQKKNIAARAKKGETQAALAEEYGVDKATISHVVHGAAEPIGWVVDRHKPTRAIPVYKTYGDNEGYAGKQPRGKKRAKHYDVRLFDFYPTLEAANVAIAKAKDNNDSARAAKKGAPLPPDPVQTMDPPGDGEDDADTDAPAGDADSEDVDDIVGSLNDLLRKGDELHVALVAFIQEQADYSAADRIAVWDALGRLATRAENLQGRIDTD